MKILEPSSKKLYVDATFGQGGYTKEIFKNFFNCKIIAIDRDPNSKKYIKQYQSSYKTKFFLFNKRFSELRKIINKFGEKIDGIVFDLGLSNTQLEDPSRGFSFNSDGPLDMRMGNQIDSKITAEKVINEFSERDLSDIFSNSEKKKSFKIARAIISERKKIK